MATPSFGTYFAQALHSLNDGMMAYNQPDAYQQMRSARTDMAGGQGNGYGGPLMNGGAGAQTLPSQNPKVRAAFATLNARIPPGFDQLMTTIGNDPNAIANLWKYAAAASKMGVPASLIQSAVHELTQNSGGFV